MILATCCMVDALLLYVSNNCVNVLGPSDGVSLKYCACLDCFTSHLIICIICFYVIRNCKLTNFICKTNSVSKKNETFPLICPGVNVERISVTKCY